MAKAFDSDASMVIPTPSRQLFPKDAQVLPWLLTRIKVCAEKIGSAPLDLNGEQEQNDPTTSALVEMLLGEIEDTDGVPGVFAERVVDLVCLQVLRAQPTPSERPPVRRRGGLAGWKVKRVSDYMHDNMHRDVSLQELADLLGISRCMFCSAFRAATNYTPLDWFLRIRVREAKELLKDPSLSIAAVAQAVGYRSPSAFTKAFRRTAGYTPTQHRRGLR